MGRCRPDFRANRSDPLAAKAAGNFADRRSLDRIERHAIGDVGAQLGHLAGDFGTCSSLMPGMMIVLIFTVTPRCFSAANGFAPGGSRAVPRRRAAVDPLCRREPRRKSGADLRIDRIDRQRDVADAQRGQIVHVAVPRSIRWMPRRGAVRGGAWRTRRSVSRVRSGVAKGSPGPAIPTTAIRGSCFEHAFQVVQGLRRREQGAGHARPALVRAVVDPLAEVALDVALRRHRKMDPGERVPRSVVETGMSRKVQGHGRS